MRVQSALVASILLITLVIGLSYVFYYSFTATTQHILQKPEQTAEKPLKIPPKVEAVTKEANAIKKTVTVCLYVYNPNDVNLDVNAIKFLTSSGIHRPTSSDCNQIPPHSTCKICVELNSWENKENIKVLLPNIPATPVKVNIPSYPPTIDLSSPTKTVYLNVSYPYTVHLSLIASDTDGNLTSLIIDCGNDDTVDYNNQNPATPITVDLDCTYPSEGKYTITITATDDNNHTTKKSLDLYFYSISLSHNLTFAPPEEDRYDSVLFHGEYNKVFVTISGPEGTYTVSGDCIQTVSKPCSSCTLETNTTTTSPSCNITVKTPFNHSFTFTYPVWHYFECNSADSCENKLATAESLSSSTDTNILVLLTSDIKNNYIYLSYRNFNNKVVFDGNSHDINNSQNDYAIYFNEVNNLRVRNINLEANRGTLYLYSSSNNTFTHTYLEANQYALYVYYHSDVNIEDANIEANTDAVLLARTSTVKLTHSKVRAKTHALDLMMWSHAYLSDTNFYADEKVFNHDTTNGCVQFSKNSSCFLTNDPTPYPILAFSEANNGQEVNLHYKHYCHISIHDANNLTLEHGTIGISKDGKLLVDGGAIVMIHESAGQKVKFVDINAVAKTLALDMYKNSILTLKDSNIFALQNYALHSSCYNCTNSLTVDVNDGNTYVYSPGGYDWYIGYGTLKLSCVNCESGYYLVSDVNDVSGDLDTSDCNCAVKPS